jgi:ribosomal protein L28
MKICELCGKHKSVGNIRKLLRGHRNVTAKRDFKPNLQKTVIDGQRHLVCTQCLRTLHKADKTN